MLAANLPRPSEPNFDLMLATIRELMDDPENVEVRQRAGVIFLNVHEAMRVMQKFRGVAERLNALDESDMPSLEQDLSDAQSRLDELDQRLATVKAKRDAAFQGKKQILDRFERVMRLRDDVVESGAIRPKRHPDNPAKSLRQGKIDPVFAAFFGEEVLERVRDIESEHFPKFGRWQNTPDGE